MILFLIGFRATGKTTIGRLLADRLDCQWLDTDSEIEKFSQRSITEIFQDDGESGFRTIEGNVVSLLVKNVRHIDTAVISLGGGAVLSEVTRALVAKRGKAVWLTAPAECLVRRIEATRIQTPRPALSEMSLSDEVSRLLSERQTVYSDCADCTFDTSELSVEQSVEQIALWWSEVDK